jgi:diguanylate cyclase (GGDEF)-like protein
VARVFKFILDHRRWKQIGWFALSLGPVISLFIWLREHPGLVDPFVYGYLEAIGSVLAFTCATTAILRFRGANNRIALFVALGLITLGFTETFFGLTTFLNWLHGKGGTLLLPMEWIACRTFFAIVLLVALYVEHRLPAPRAAGREVAGAMVLTIAVGYFTALFYGGAAWLGFPVAEVYLPGALLSRPPHLIPALLFFIAARQCHRRLNHADAIFDRALFIMAALGMVVHVLAAFSGEGMTATLLFAQLVKVTSYATLLGGALFDHVRLFDQVRHLAVSDPLTGLANYRRFNDAMQAEMHRSQRTSRPFAILLLDLDGLKHINDTLGHEFGSRAICRLADVLRLHCRSVDTAARFGGDEFALVLPETDFTAATRVAQRIRERLAADSEQPALSASIGVAVFPRHGRTLEALQRVADQELYAMKRSLRRKRRAAKAASAASAA